MLLQKTFTVCPKKKHHLLLHRLDYGFDELLLGLGEAVFRVELRVDLPREVSRVRMVLVT